MGWKEPVYVAKGRVARARSGEALLGNLLQRIMTRSKETLPKQPTIR